VFDKEKGFSPLLMSSLLTIGFLGLLVCSLIDRFFLGESRENHPVFYNCLFFFLALYVITLLVIFPVQILYFHRKNRDDSSLKKATLKDIAAIPFGVSNPDARIPKWVSIPVYGFLWLLVSILILGLGGVIISEVTHFFNGQ